ncbi:MAG: YaiO family outer membrane beta-barrel protein [Alphaproteobacteria bacterium]|nr:YaiO family outer membrane beta-barrel protein [Alphaproteobacteria bacterium]MCB9931716.1 YaiO family outer membrane beta-barrel protein [Alphaproteobacteria bacterium]
MTHRLLRSCAAVILFGVAAVIAGAAQGQSVSQLYREGVEARQARDFSKAVALLQQARALDPENADVLVQLGFAQLGRGDPIAAHHAFSDALELAPDYLDANYGIALVRFRQRRFAEARAIMQRLTEAAPERRDFAALFGGIKKAMANARAVRSKPNRPPAVKPRVAALPDRMEQARRQKEDGDLAGAEATYRRALALAPENFDVLYALGLVSAQQQKYEDARHFYHAALAVVPGSIAPRLGLVRLAIWQNDLAAAREQIDQLKADAPDNVEVALVEARIAFLEGDLVRAEAGYAAILARWPKNVPALVGLGDARRQRQDEDGAREAYGRALAAAPGSQAIQHRLVQPAPRRWQIRLNTEGSNLTNGRGSWTDSVTTLSWQWAPETTVSVRSRLATRYGRTDVEPGIRVDHRHGQYLSAFAETSGTPDADFLPRFKLGGGVGIRVAKPFGPLGPLYLHAEVAFEHYGNSNIWTAKPGLQLYGLDQRLAVSMRWIRSEDDRGATSDGYLLRADAVVTDRLRGFAGYADAPEISLGRLEEVQTVFGGVAAEISQDLTVQASFAHEQRRAFNRDSVGVGLTIRF